MNDEIILTKFAERFSDLVKNSSIDVPTLIKMLGIKSKSTIYRYMNAEMTPKIPMVKYAAEIFNVNPLWLMGYDVPKSNEPSNNKSNDFRFASYNGIDTEGLDEKDIEEINAFIEFIKNKKKNDKKK